MFCKRLNGKYQFKYVSPKSVGVEVDPVMRRVMYVIAGNDVGV